MAELRSWRHRRAPGEPIGAATRESYYGLPVIHGPHWHWPIVFYFLLGGLAGGSAVLAAAARLLGGRSARPVVRAGRYLAFLAVLPGPLLLIVDLGRPERFHHMLRVIKLRSPMSLGVWGLIAFSLSAFLNALRQAVDDGFFGRSHRLVRGFQQLPDRALAIASTVPAFFLAGYTGVLLGATAVPLWARNALLLGPLFLCSALSSAAATLSLLLARRSQNDRAEQALAQVEFLALTGEVALLEAVHRKSGPVIGRPLRHGAEGRAFAGARATTAAALALHGLALLLPRRWRQRLELPASILALAGAFLLRATMVFGGHRSADDPAATFALTRSDE
ncbi:MAG: polysulfide reductase NrfD [Thermomicrobium sp.]|jgi:formate-dependent nitrite reductase membrane component NrfD|uniref:NrfD/PsrC family molybdoenzyme membrane anchor subunit n=1 Tax=Thermomicrobium sp. TaxID=1969469 RepID=UPI001B18EE1C|nr:NrfD/PsrC family molybdoenzyme membrane anchor subunit [Thermomicrobium sp.]MBO9351898.1 polysulfide reductase NrfD [Thermomicrobium sp.]